MDTYVNIISAIIAGIGIFFAIKAFIVLIKKDENNDFFYRSKLSSVCTYFLISLFFNFLSFVIYSNA